VGTAGLAEQIQEREDQMSCPHCADGLDRGDAHRVRVLNLLALLEHPSALPADAALRICRELLAWVDDDAPDRRSGEDAAEAAA
jgi:hypothetical protein